MQVLVTIDLDSDANQLNYVYKKISYYECLHKLLSAFSYQGNNFQTRYMDIIEAQITPMSQFLPLLFLPHYWRLKFVSYEQYTFLPRLSELKQDNIWTIASALWENDENEQYTFYWRPNWIPLNIVLATVGKLEVQVSLVMLENTFYWGQIAPVLLLILYWEGFRSNSDSWRTKIFYTWDANKDYNLVGILFSLCCSIHSL